VRVGCLRTERDPGQEALGAATAALVCDGFLSVTFAPAPLHAHRTTHGRALALEAMLAGAMYIQPTFAFEGGNPRYPAELRQHFTSQVPLSRACSCPLA